MIFTLFAAVKLKKMLMETVALTFLYVISRYQCRFVLLTASFYAWFHICYETIYHTINYLAYITSLVGIENVEIFGIWHITKLWFYVCLSISILYDIASAFIIHQHKQTKHWKIFCIMYQYEIILELIMQITSNRLIYSVVATQIMLFKLWDEEEKNIAMIGSSYFFTLTVELFLMGQVTSLPPGLLTKLMLVAAHKAKYFN